MQCLLNYLLKTINRYIIKGLAAAHLPSLPLLTAHFSSASINVVTSPQLRERRQVHADGLELHERLPQNRLFRQVCILYMTILKNTWLK